MEQRNYYKLLKETGEENISFKVMILTFYKKYYITSKLSLVTKTCPEKSI